MRTFAFGLVVSLFPLLGACAVPTDASGPGGEVDAIHHEIGNGTANGEAEPAGSSGSSGGLKGGHNVVTAAATDPNAEPTPIPWMEPTPLPWNPSNGAGGANGGAQKNDPMGHAKHRMPPLVDQQ
jgi:hypothetical protein